MMESGCRLDSVQNLSFGWLPQWIELGIQEKWCNARNAIGQLSDWSDAKNARFFGFPEENPLRPKVPAVWSVEAIHFYVHSVRCDRMSVNDS